MSSLAKGIRTVGIGRNNLVVTLFVLGVIAALFFIPEFIGLQRTLIENNDSGSSAREVDTVALPATDRKVVKNDSPLDKLANMFRSESAQHEDIEARASLALQPGKPDMLPSEIEVDSLLEKKGAEQFLPGNEPITWKVIRSNPSARHFKEAQREANAIAKSLGSDYPASRFALMNFSAGIARVLNDAEKVMTPDEGIQYLEYLDRSVTDVMLKERVERGDFMQWAKVSLGPLLSHSRGQRIKQRLVPNFNPRLTLSDVMVFKPADRFGKWRPQGRAYVRVQGYIIGKDAKKVTISHNMGRERKVMVHRQPDKLGRRTFKLAQRDAQGLYTLTVYDKEGNTFTKHYNFYGRAARFAWLRNKKGRFAIPYGTNDPRLDRLFMVSGSAGGERAKGIGNLSESSQDSAFTSF